MPIVEETYEVKTFMRNATHKDCGGTFKATGLTLTSNPPWYVHTCTKCNTRENLRHQYPYTFVEKIELDPTAI